jgi:hypothetical protein
MLSPRNRSAISFGMLCMLLMTVGFALGSAINWVIDYRPLLWWEPWGYLVATAGWCVNIKLFRMLCARDVF